MEVSGQLHTTGGFTPREKSPCYPMVSRMGEPQSRCGHGGEERNSQPVPELEPSTTQHVAQGYNNEPCRLPHQ
jgi:hypothetical protein